MVCEYSLIPHYSTAHVWPDFIKSPSKGGFEQMENVGKGSYFLGTSDSDIELFPSKNFLKLR